MNASHPLGAMRREPHSWRAQTEKALSSATAPRPGAPKAHNKPNRVSLGGRPNTGRCAGRDRGVEWHRAARPPPGAPQGWALQGGPLRAGRANFARPTASLRPPWQTPTNPHDETTHYPLPEANPHITTTTRILTMILLGKCPHYYSAHLLCACAILQEGGEYVPRWAKGGTQGLSF